MCESCIGALRVVSEPCGAVTAFSLGMILCLKKKKRERTPAVQAQILTRVMIAEGLR